jgi:DNA-binding transcriptional LysR family regulator
MNAGRPMSNLLDIDQLRTFVAIAETGSFTRAAEVVHKTQSAVSMQMKRLEERIGRPIFERDGRTSKLTEEGERLLDYAQRIVRLNAEALSSIGNTNLSGRVRLGVPESGPALAHVMKLAPTKPKDHLMVMTMCGRRDKDIFTVAQHLEVAL